MELPFLQEGNVSNMVESLIAIGVKVLIVTVLSGLVLLVSKFLIAKLRDRWINDEEYSFTAKRARTLSAIIWAVTKTVILIVSVMLILSQMGVNLAPVLATAGVGGLAVGFGAQTIVKDVLKGFFLLMEYQIFVGDVVKIGDVDGVVEKITLRTITLRDLSGNLHIIPHGSVDIVTNMTRGHSYYVFDINVDYDEDTDRVVDVLKQVAADLQTDPTFGEFILAPLEVLGVDQFGDSAVVIKVRIKTQPAKQWEVGREMNRRIKKTFEQEGIEIPYPHLALVYRHAEDADERGRPKNRGNGGEKNYRLPPGSRMPQN